MDSRRAAAARCPPDGVRRRAARGPALPVLARRHRPGRTRSSARTPAWPTPGSTYRRRGRERRPASPTSSARSGGTASSGSEQIPDLVERRAAQSGGRFRATSVKIMQDGVCENFTAAMLDAVPRRARPRHRQRGPLVRRGRGAEGDRGRRSCGRLPGARARDRRPRRPRGARRVRGRARDRSRRARRAAPPHRPPPAGAPRRRAALRRRSGVAANAQALWACHERADGRPDHPVPRRRSARPGSTRSATSTAPGPGWSMGSDWPVTSPDPLAAIHTAVTRTAYDDPGAQAVPARAGARPRRPRSRRTRPARRGSTAATAPTAPASSRPATSPTSSCSTATRSPGRPTRSGPPGSPRPGSAAAPSTGSERTPEPARTGSDNAPSCQVTTRRGER